jgi:hypothetical protein
MEDEFLNERGIGPVGDRHKPLPRLPYRHDLLIRVTVADDGPTGEHGYIDVAARLATLIAGLDPHVVDVSSLPAGVTYLGKTEFFDSFAPIDNPAGFDSAGGVA